MAEPVLNLKPFRVKSDWYYVANRIMYGPFYTKQAAQEAYAIALTRANLPN